MLHEPGCQTGLILYAVGHNKQALIMIMAKYYHVLMFILSFANGEIDEENYRSRTV